MAKTLIHKLIGYFPTPVDDWVWLQVPNTGIAISLPKTWRVDVALNKKDWCGKAESGVMSKRGGPSIHGIIDDISGGPKQVKMRFEIMCKMIEDNRQLTIHRRFRDHRIPLLNYGYSFSFIAGMPITEWTIHERYIAFINAGFVLTLRGACASHYWESEHHIFEQSFEKLVIFELKEFFSNN